jgi:hypothetical protein
MGPMGALLFAALISTLHLEGQVEKAGGDYVLVEFQVPAGTVELRVVHAGGGPGEVLDWGVEAPEGFRGWGGGLTEPAEIGVTAASRGYLPGPITPGTWRLVIGKALVGAAPVRWTADLSFFDAPTLAAASRAPFTPRALRSGARFYAGDFHVHSRESGDANATFDEIVALARGRGLDFVVLSDHNTTAQMGLQAARQASLDDLLLVRGIEVTTYAGHGNAIGVSAYVDHRIGHAGRTAAALVDDVAAQGGFFVINHPALDLGDACIGCAWRHEAIDWAKVGAVEILTGPLAVSTLLTPAALALWDRRLDEGHRLAAVGGSDDHRAGKDTGPGASRIGSPTTLVWADELSEPALLAGLRAGRTVVKLGGPEDPLVELTAGGPDGAPVRIGGDTAGARVTVAAHVVGGAGRTLVLVRNGKEERGVPVESDDWTHAYTLDVRPEGDRLRAHLYDGGALLVVTGHIYATYAPAGCGCDLPGRTVPSGAALLCLALLLLTVRRRAARTPPTRSASASRSPR